MSAVNDGTTVATQPHLLPTLHSALCSLYSLSTTTTTNNGVLVKDAHEFLIEFQGRNLIRKYNDKRRRGDIHATPTEDEAGSTWYACLYMLYRREVYAKEECLFAAQTLLHRVRRLKLKEAVDYDMEFGYPEMAARLSVLHPLLQN
eukprot:11553706-Ditylum_brightwellii.AAC.1